VRFSESRSSTSLAKNAVLGTAEEIFVLDNAFALIEGRGPPLSTLRQAQRAHCAAAMRARAATLIFQRGRCVLSRLLLCNPLNARTAVSLERPRYFSPLSPQLREYVHVIFLGQRLSQDPGNIG